MERLTFVDEKGNVLFTPKGCSEDVGYTIIQVVEGGHIDLLNEIASRLANYEQRLKRYEDLDEQGLLLRLPCKVGNIEGFNKGYSKAENDYHAQSEKDRQSSYDCGYEVGYSKSIDDFADRLCHKIKSEIDDCADELDWIDEIAEQLKEGEENGK